MSKRLLTASKVPPWSAVYFHKAVALNLCCKPSLQRKRGSHFIWRYLSCKALIKTMRLRKFKGFRSWKSLVQQFLNSLRSWNLIKISKFFHLKGQHQAVILAAFMGLFVPQEMQFPLLFHVFDVRLLCL